MMIRIELSLNSLEKAIKRLPVKDRIKLIGHLLSDEETWRQQFRKVMRRIDARTKKHPITQKEINAAMEQSRQEIYDKSRR